MEFWCGRHKINYAILQAYYSATLVQFLALYSLYKVVEGLKFLDCMISRHNRPATRKYQKYCIYLKKFINITWESIQSLHIQKLRLIMTPTQPCHGRKRLIVQCNWLIAKKAPEFLKGRELCLELNSNWHFASPLKYFTVGLQATALQRYNSAKLVLKKMYA